MFTVPEAARRVRKHPETIRRWIRSGRLRAERVGTQHLIHEDDLAAVTDADAVALPDSWALTDQGAPMPPWERLVRDARASH